MIGVLCGETTTSTRREKVMNSQTRLTAWIEGAKGTPDPFKLAVIQGTVAQETIAMTLRLVVAPDGSEIEPPKWLVQWAASLTSDEVETIRTQRDAKTATLREDVDLLFDEDPEKWTKAEHAHAKELGQQLLAVNLVLQAWEKARAATTFFLPMEATTAATAAA